MSKRSVKSWPVMASKCATCPFRDGVDKDLAARVLSRTILQASQICHRPRLHGKKETHLCRGVRDEQLTVLYRLGLIAEPTDQSFTETSNQLLGGRHEQHESSEPRRN
jgi:hypothetical protein